MRSINEHRLSQNPKEEECLLEWEKTHGYKTLRYILDESHGNRGDAMVSMRDELVAATIIQWLGSPVGEAFLNSVGFGQE